MKEGAKFPFSIYSHSAFLINVKIVTSNRESNYLSKIYTLVGRKLLVKKLWSDKENTQKHAHTYPKVNAEIGHYSRDKAGIFNLYTGLVETKASIHETMKAKRGYEVTRHPQSRHPKNKTIRGGAGKRSNVKSQEFSLIKSWFYIWKALNINWLRKKTARVISLTQNVSF